MAGRSRPHECIKHGVARYQCAATRPKQSGIKIKASPPPQRGGVLLPRCLQKNRPPSLKKRVLLSMVVHIQGGHCSKPVIAHAHDTRAQRQEKHTHPTPTHCSMVGTAILQRQVPPQHTTHVALAAQQLPACQTQRRLPGVQPTAGTALLVNVQVQVLSWYKT